MNETEIRKYTALMTELGLTGLEFGEGPNRVRLERSAAQPETAAAPSPIPTALPAQPAPASADSCITVFSPLVGLFYAAPAENAAPYVAPGDRIKKGQVLCIIEAMKLINEVCAEEDGIIEEVCVSNGQMVEYGTVLFRIRR